MGFSTNNVRRILIGENIKLKKANKKKVDTVTTSNGTLKMWLVLIVSQRRYLFEPVTRQYQARTAYTFSN